MYGIYFDYNGYERKLMAICPTIIECKRLLVRQAKLYNISYKELMEDGYSIVNMPLNKWTHSL